MVTVIVYLNSRYSTELKPNWLMTWWSVLNATVKSVRGSSGNRPNFNIYFGLRDITRYWDAYQQQHQNEQHRVQLVHFPNLYGNLVFSSGGRRRFSAACGVHSLHYNPSKGFQKHTSTCVDAIYKEDKTTRKLIDYLLLVITLLITGCWWLLTVQRTLYSCSDRLGETAK